MVRTGAEGRQGDTTVARYPTEVSGCHLMSVSFPYGAGFTHGRRALCNTAALTKTPAAVASPVRPARLACPACPV